MTDLDEALDSPLDDDVEVFPGDDVLVGRSRSVVAVGGGRPGVGKTLLSVNLAVYLAQLGRHVVLCDADPFGSSLHTMLGVERPPLVLDKAPRGKESLVATSVPGLWLLPAVYDPWAVAPKRASRQSHWLRQIRDLDVDYVVLNLGASIVPASLDVFAEADVQICVSAPEPPAIEATYRFCRAYFVRRLRKALMRERFKLRVVERALATLPPLPSPRDLIIEVARFDEPVANVAATVLASLRPRLVIGRTRLRRDLDLGPAMAALSARHLGMALDYMGYVEQDDAAWLTARRNRPLLIDAPTSKAARNLERVARRLLALLAQQAMRPPAVENAMARSLTAPMTLYDVLGLQRGATDDEIRRAFKLQREIYNEGSLPLTGLLDERRTREEQGRIAEAYDTLLDPPRRRAYDLSVFPEDDAGSQQGATRPPTATEAELALLRAELAREITPETQFSGPTLRRAREALGIELSDIAAQTKISAAYLRAIEADDHAALPAAVYVRGFLVQVARVLRLDSAQVAKSYLKRLRGARGELDE
ncbi:MAG: helix-turn-helix domain-containing protein [Deltaproteobacteria bacterium]|nr:helix-turn-helix domain-containing protein [Deltaproteobacteria bacterium]